jgi:hypothetical protein
MRSTSRLTFFGFVVAVKEANVWYWWASTRCARLDPPYNRNDSTVRFPKAAERATGCLPSPVAFRNLLFKTNGRLTPTVRNGLELANSLPGGFLGRFLN